MIAVTILALGGCSGREGVASQQVSVYDRVIKAGTIRASYANYPPYCIKDPNTGELSGMCVDILNEVGRRLELRVEWTEEVGWGAIFEGLNSDRHDVFGAGIWRNASRGKVGDFSRPMFYNVINIYGRASEDRFTNVSQLNTPSVRISALDGAMEDVIAKSDFPLAQEVSISQLNPWSEVLLNITSHKADVTFAEPSAINLYLEKNPGTIKQILPGAPLRIFANCFAFKLGEPKFKAMLESGIDEVMNDGTVERIIAKYETRPGEYLRIASPYANPEH